MIVLFYAEWCLWSATALLMLHGWHVLAVRLIEGRTARFAHIASAAMLTWLVSWFLINDDLSKLHLLWMVPIAFLGLELLQSIPTRRST